MGLAPPFEPSTLTQTRIAEVHLDSRDSQLDVQRPSRGCARAGSFTERCRLAERDRVFQVLDSSGKVTTPSCGGEDGSQKDRSKRCAFAYTELDLEIRNADSHVDVDMHDPVCSNARRSIFQ